jgi:hypothetical protein
VSRRVIEVVIDTKRLYADGKFGGKDGKVTFMEAKWRGLQAPGKEEQKSKFKYLMCIGTLLLGKVSWRVRSGSSQARCRAAQAARCGADTDI